MKKKERKERNPQRIGKASLKKRKIYGGFLA